MFWCLTQLNRNRGWANQLLAAAEKSRLEAHIASDIHLQPSSSVCCNIKYASHDKIDADKRSFLSRKRD